MGIFSSTDPTTWDDVDGIIVNESAPPANVQGVAANIGILVGQAQRGPATMQEPGSIGSFHEMYGKSSSYGMNLALRNKKFGRIKFIRVVASDAVQASKAFQSSATNRITFSAKQGKGEFGNNVQVKIEEASSSRQEIHTVLCIADVADALDQKYFILRDEVGTVGVWLDVDDNGGTAPAGALACARQIEVTTIITGDSASVVAGKIAAVLESDSKFTASALSATLTATCIAYAPGVGTIGNGDSGFTVTQTQLGVAAGRKYTIRDSNSGSVLPQEVYDDVKLSEVAGDLTFAGSQLVEAVVNSSAAEPTAVAFTSLESGSDGTVADSDYETAIAVAAVEKAGNVIFLDSYNTARNGYLKQHVADTTDKMCIICGTEAQTVSEAVTDAASYRDTEGRIIYAYPWVENRIDGVLTFVNPASYYASIITQTAPNIDPAYVKNSQFLSGITSLKRSISRTQYIQLKDAGVSAFEFDEDIGFKIKSGIVTQIADSSKVTVLRRRMTDFLTQSASRYLKNYQNAVNSYENRRDAGAALLTFVEGLERDGLLPKDSEVQTGKAKLIDPHSQNTDNSIGQGFFKILWKQRLYSSMRYIVLSAEVGETVVVTEDAA